MNRDAIFEEITLILREGPSKVNPFSSHLVRLIEGLSNEILGSSRGFWCDGVAQAEIHRIKTKVFTITGEMWVAKGSKEQWKEAFFVRLSDRRCTSQGIGLRIQIGPDRRSVDLTEVLAELERD